MYDSTNANFLGKLSMISFIISHFAAGRSNFIQGGYSLYVSSYNVCTQFIRDELYRAGYILLCDLYCYILNVFATESRFESDSWPLFR